MKKKKRTNIENIELENAKNTEIKEQPPKKKEMRNAKAKKGAKPSDKKAAPSLEKGKKIKKKAKQEEVVEKLDEEVVLEEKEENKEKPISKGMRVLKDLLAPSGFNREDENSIGVGDKYVRSFVVNGYPNIVQVGWLDSLYNSEEDIDVSFHIMPTDERSALDELNLEITKQEAQLQHEYKSGSIKNLSKLQNKISQLYAQREKLEQNQEKMYHSCVVANLHSSTKEELDKATYRLQHTLGARKVDIMSLYLRQDDGYRAALPYGVNSYLEDMNRSINTGGIVASFPFYNSEISHKNGIFLGLNMTTGTPMFLDMYDRNILNNGNMTVFGASGSGKTFLVSLMTARSVIKGISSAIVDPEGEYVEITKALGGRHVTIGPDSKTRINPFDISEEYDPDEKKLIVNVKNKIGDVLNLVAVMAEGLDPEQKSIVSIVLRDLYTKDWGISEDPESLFNSEERYDPVTKEFIHAGERKIMPTFSDFYRKLGKYVEKNPQPNLKSLLNTLTMYTSGNVYDIWDCQTTEDLKNLGDSPIITFDVSKLEDQVMRSLGMFSCLTWIWESWIKKDHTRKKKIIIDEAWMMVDPDMAGSEYTASFLNVAARRCRKRKAGLLVASQSFHEFVNNPKGLAVLMNASVNMFLKTEPIAIDSIQETFKMSDGERNFLMAAKKGQVLIRMGAESCVGFVVPFDYEKKLIENPFAKKTAKEEDDYE